MGGRGRQKKREEHVESPRARGLTPLHREHAESLRWHWATREADSGLKSSHGALVEMIRTGATPQGRASYDDGMVARVDAKADVQAAHRRIETALAKLTMPHRHLLFVAYGEPAPDAKKLGALAAMGDAALVAWLTPASREAYRNACARVRRRVSLNGADGSSLLRGQLATLKCKGVWAWLLARTLPADAAILAEVESQARLMMRDAHDAFAAALDEKRVRKPRSVSERVESESFSPVWSGA